MYSCISDEFFKIPHVSEIIILSLWLTSLSLMLSVSILIVTNGRVFIIFMAKFYICMYEYQFSCSVLSDSLWPHELQHARPPCPSPTSGAYPNSCPLNWWCLLTISSSVVPFSSCLQSFPASGSFQKSQLFTSDGQSTGVSASTSVLPMNTQDWFPLGWAGWIFL